MFRKRHPLSFWCAVHDTPFGGESPLWRFVITQLLAESQGAHCEVESEGSRRQNSAPRNTNHIRHIRWDEAAKQVKVQRLHRQRGVNMAGRWGES